MIVGLFRRHANEHVIDRLYAAIVTASRQPALYVDHAIPDTFEGRFESLTLHAVVVLRRLRACAAPGPDMAQHLVDTIFRHFDRTLREMGVGDTSVPKRMKRLAEAFLGRCTVYQDAIGEGPAALAPALRRNVYADARDGVALASYILAAVQILDERPLQAFMDGTIAFPDAARPAKDTAA